MSDQNLKRIEDELLPREFQNDFAPPAPPPAPAPVEPEDDGIEIVMVKHKHRVEVDMDKLTFKDMRYIQSNTAKAQKGELSEEEGEAFLDYILTRVTGQKAADMPLPVVNRILETVFAAANARTDAVKN